MIRLGLGVFALVCLFLVWLLFCGLKPIELEKSVLVTIERGATLKNATKRTNAGELDTSHASQTTTSL